MDGWRTLALYVAGGAVYIAVSVAFPRLILSWVEGAAFLVLVVWLLPRFFGRRR